MYILEWDALYPQPPSYLTEQQKRDHNKYIFDTYVCPKYNSDNNFIKNEVENPSCSTSCRATEGGEVDPTSWINSCKFALYNGLWFPNKDDYEN